MGTDTSQTIPFSSTHVCNNKNGNFFCRSIRPVLPAISKTLSKLCLFESEDRSHTSRVFASRYLIKVISLRSNTIGRTAFCSSQIVESTPPPCPNQLGRIHDRRENVQASVSRPKCRTAEHRSGFVAVCPFPNPKTPSSVPRSLLRQHR